MRRSVVPAATTTAVAAVVVCGVLITVIGCEDSGGVREEGTAGNPAGASVKTYATSSAGVDLVELVKQDRKVAADIREDLVACGGGGGGGGEDSYPVDARFGDLTGSASGTDMIVNVSTCADSVGIGSYVYQLRNGRYHNVFGDEEPPVVAGISENGELRITHQVYGPLDPVSNPSGEDITTYRWTGTRFTEISSTHRTYASKDSRDSHG